MTPSDEQIQDLLRVGNPTDEEYRLIRTGWDAAMRERTAMSVPEGWTLVPIEFLEHVIGLCTHRGSSPESIESWDKEDKWIADLWRQAREMLAAAPEASRAP